MSAVWLAGKNPVGHRYGGECGVDSLVQVWDSVELGWNGVAFDMDPFRDVGRWPNLAGSACAGVFLAPESQPLEEHSPVGLPCVAKCSHQRGCAFELKKTVVAFNQALLPCVCLK